LPTILSSQDLVDQAVEAVQNELREERGPNFYKIPVLFTELGVPEEVQG
jgi:hypothetical protein